MSQAKKIGGKRTFKKVFLGVKIAPDLKRRVERAAKTATRSISAEVETSLERAARDQDFLGGAEVQRVLDKIALAFAHEGQRTADTKQMRGSWIGDHECYVAAMLAAWETLQLNQPDPPKGTTRAVASKVQIESYTSRMATHFWKTGGKQ